MNISEVSKALGLSEKTIRRHIKRGSLQAKIVEGEHGKEYDVSE